MIAYFWINKLFICHLKVLEDECEPLFGRLCIDPGGPTDPDQVHEGHIVVQLPGQLAGPIPVQGQVDLGQQKSVTEGHLLAYIW